jgi:hypothetical protein
LRTGVVSIRYAMLMLDDDLADGVTLTGERGFVSDIDVLVLAMLLDGLLETLDALHEGRSGFVT